MELNAAKQVLRINVSSKIRSVAHACLRSSQLLLDIVEAHVQRELVVIARRHDVSVLPLGIAPNAIAGCPGLLA